MYFYLQTSSLLSGKAFNSQYNILHFEVRNVSYTKDQQKRVNLAKFYDAILQAKGVKLHERDTKDGKGPAPTYRACVHKNGQLVIGAKYTDEMGLKPGDEFAIQLGHKHIHLRQVIAEVDTENQNNEEE